MRATYSVNEGLGKESYRRVNSVKRSGTSPVEVQIVL